MHSDRSTDLEQALRRSRKALPVQVVMAIAVIAVAWALHRFLGVPAWFTWLLGVLGATGAVGDALNIMYVRRALRRSRSAGE